MEHLSFLFKQRGAVLAPPLIRVRHPLKSAGDLFRSRWFAIGWGVSVLGWFLHVGALSNAPLSTVQAVLAGGLVFLAVLAERFFGFQLRRRQWAAVIITALGLVIVGLTGGGGGARHSSLAALIAVESGVFGLGAGLVLLSTHSSVEQRREGLLLATAAGALFGVSDVAVKYLTHVHGPLRGLVSPWTLTAVVSFVISFYASARSLQIGLPIEVGCASLLEAVRAAGYTEGPLLEFGRSRQRELTETWTSCTTAVVGAGDPFLGVAHGWGGLAFAALRFSALSFEPVAPAVVAGLDELESLAHRDGDRAWWPHGPTDEAVWPGWCHGSAGHAMLWAQAHRVVRTGR